MQSLIEGIVIFLIFLFVIVIVAGMAATIIEEVGGIKNLLAGLVVIVVGGFVVSVFI